MEWLVKNAVNRDVERQHLNKILQDIKATVQAVTKQLDTLRMANGQQDIQSIVGAMVSNNSERGLAVSYNQQNKTLDFVAKDFSITLQGDVVGSGVVRTLSNVTIETSLSNNIAAPDDGHFYWQHNGQWEAVLPTVEDLLHMVGGGIVVRTPDGDAGGYQLRAIEGTVDEVDVVNGDGIAANPVISLADLADTNTGTFKLILRDTKGRLLGTTDGTTDDVPEGIVNLYFPEAPADGRQYARQDEAWVEISGGVLPVVTGDIVDGQPVFVFADNGSLIYTEIM